MSRQTHTTATGYMSGGVSSPDVGGVARPKHVGRGRNAIALTVRLDVEALDEQLQREREAEHDDDRGGW